MNICASKRKVVRRVPQIPGPCHFSIFAFPSLPFPYFRLLSAPFFSLSLWSPSLFLPSLAHYKFMLSNSTVPSLLLKNSLFVGFIMHSPKHLLQPSAFRGPCPVSSVRLSADDLPPTSPKGGEHPAQVPSFALLTPSLSLIPVQPSLLNLDCSVPAFHSSQTFPSSLLSVLLAFLLPLIESHFIPTSSNSLFSLLRENIKSLSYNLRNLCLKHPPNYVYWLFIFNSDCLNEVEIYKWVTNTSFNSNI